MVEVTVIDTYIGMVRYLPECVEVLWHYTMGYTVSRPHLARVLLFIKLAAIIYVV